MTKRFYTYSELCLHNNPDDLWISFLGRVYDLTPLSSEFRDDILMRPILSSSGTDISHWFEIESQDIRTHIDPITKCNVPFTPIGRFLHIPPQGPRTDWSSNMGKPWWADDQYFIGKLSEKTRKVLIMDTLISKEQVIEACIEENISDIALRYLKFNKHGFSYTWKFKGKYLDMNKTLQENGIVDECEQHCELRLDESQYLPQIQIFYNDDLTD